jgi:hypothetical protein
MSARDIALLERQRIGGDYYDSLPELSDAQRAEAVETALRRSPRLRDRIVSAAEVVLAEEGFHLEEFLQE